MEITIIIDYLIISIVASVAINSILNKHQNDEICIFLSHINKKFAFLFPNLHKKIFSINLNIFEKINIFIYFLINKIDSVYVLTPKSYYYFLPLFFRNTKFFAITIKAKRNRPSKYFLSYLYKYVVLDRINLKKRDSSYNIQKRLINIDSISDGGAAMMAYAFLQFSDIGSQEKQSIEKALLRYCELDTMAMVMIMEAFIDWAK